MAKKNNHISQQRQNQTRVSPRQLQQQTTTQPPPPPAVTSAAAAAAGVSNLGANLNELDYLLQDLNSAQFMRDISRSGSGVCDVHLTFRMQPQPKKLFVDSCLQY